jgi:putative colanic acid biosynthesis acetyltransferase WcaF
MAKVDLSLFRNEGFQRGRPIAVEFFWRMVSALIFQSAFIPFYGLKRSLLRSFGAQIGRNVLIKPRVFITFPWKVSIGDHSWIGEETWLDSLDRIDIGSNVCISQRAYLCTGSHNSKSSHFDLVTKPIVVEDGAWLGAGAQIAPGVRLGMHCFVTLGSVVKEDVKPNAVVSGNPARFVRERVIET